MNLKSITTKIYVFVLLFHYFNFSFSSENDLKVFGYGRLNTEYLNFYNTDRTPDFKNLSDNEIMPLRKLWIKKFRKNESDKTLNIACIAFDFFDKNKNRLNDDLVYFKDYDQEMDRYYFVSGRLPWAEIEKEENRIIKDSNNKDRIIQREQIICLSQEIADCKNTIKKLNEIQEKDIKKADFLTTHNLLDSIKSVFLSEFLSKSSLNQKALDYENSFIESLTKNIKVPKRIINRSYEQIVYVGKDTLTKFSVHEFLTLKEDEKDYKEFMFVHSEQLALVLLKQKLKGFLGCYFAEKVKYAKKDVKVCVIYIYSYNTICARCSTSYICDFHKAEGLKSVIEGILPDANIYNVALTQVKCDTSFLSTTKLPPSKHDFYDKDLFQNQGQLIFEPSFNDYLYQYVLPHETTPNETEISSSQMDDELLLSI